MIYMVLPRSFLCSAKKPVWLLNKSICATMAVNGQKHGKMTTWWAVELLQILGNGHSGMALLIDQFYLIFYCFLWHKPANKYSKCLLLLGSKCQEDGCCRSLDISRSSWLCRTWREIFPIWTREWFPIPPWVNVGASSAGFLDGFWSLPSTANERQRQIASSWANRGIIPPF